MLMLFSVLFDVTLQVNELIYISATCAASQKTMKYNVLQPLQEVVVEVWGQLGIGAEPQCGVGQSPWNFF